MHLVAAGQVDGVAAVACTASSSQSHALHAGAWPLCAIAPQHFADNQGLGTVLP